MTRRAGARHPGAVPRLALCTLLLAALPCAAAAQDHELPQRPSAQVIAAFDEGTAHHEDERFVLAAASFQRAYDLMRALGSPNAGLILYNLATSLDEIPGREGEARAAYSRFLEEAPAGDADLQRRMATVQARIHELDARIAASGGGGDELAGPVIIGVGGAVLLAGVVVGAISMIMDADFVAACGGLDPCPTRLRSQYNEMRAFSTAADILLVAGGLFAALGIVLAVVMLEDGGEVAASCGPAGCQVRGRF